MKFWCIQDHDRRQTGVFKIMNTAAPYYSCIQAVRVSLALSRCPHGAEGHMGVFPWRMRLARRMQVMRCSFFSVTVGPTDDLERCLGCSNSAAASLFRFDQLLLTCMKVPHILPAALRDTVLYTFTITTVEIKSKQGLGFHLETRRIKLHSIHLAVFIARVDYIYNETEGHFTQLHAKCDTMVNACTHVCSLKSRKSQKLECGDSHPLGTEGPYSCTAHRGGGQAGHSRTVIWKRGACVSSTVLAPACLRY